MKVSIICLVYNHENYIRKCLDGFVSQQCDFEFEVLVHDDASTDNSAGIIREYEKKYPHIIKPIYQIENQHSKGVRISTTYLFPKVKGEYIAWCEGDDCWIDPLKLKKQVEFLDSHPDFSMCSHRVCFNNLKTQEKSYIPKITKNKEFCLDEIIKGGAIFQLSSLMFRTDLYFKKPRCFEAKGFGDIQLYIYAAICGRVMVLADVMSMYNHGTQGSWTMRVGGNLLKKIDHAEQRKKMLENVNAYYEYKYNESFQYAIDAADYELARLQGNTKECRKKKYKKFVKLERKRKTKLFIKKHFPWIVRILKNNK